MEIKLNPVYSTGKKPDYSIIKKVVDRLEICKKNGYTIEAKVWELLLDSPYKDSALMYQLINFMWEYYDPENWLEEIMDVDMAMQDRQESIQLFKDCDEYYMEVFVEDAQNYIECVYGVIPLKNAIMTCVPWLIENINVIL